jgi:hypothetical protein
MPHSVAGGAVAARSCSVGVCGPARVAPGSRPRPVNQSLTARPDATARPSEASIAMAGPTNDVKNWMNMFRWIVKLIRDDYDVDEEQLVRTAVLETDCGLVIEQVEAVPAIIAESFQLRFSPETLDEVLKLEALCMLAAWMKGLCKRPDFISGGFEAKCRALNTGCA